MNTKYKKILSVVLAVVMLAGLLQITAFAEGTYDALTLDTPYTMSLGEDSGFVTFTPEKTGDYAFYSDIGDAEADPCIVEVVDGDGYEIWLEFGDDDDMAGVDFYAVYTLTAGETYTLEIMDYGTNGEEFTVTVSEFVPTVVGALTLDTPVTVKLTEPLLLYTFTPQVSGVYAFSSKRASYADPWIAKLTDQDGNELDHVAGHPDDHNSYDFMAAYELEAGVQYTLGVSDYNADEDGFEVTVSKHYGIKTQPEYYNTSVEVYYPEDVEKYEWFKLEQKTEAVTDQNAKTLDSNYGKSTYDSTTGVWTANDTGFNCYEILEIDVADGDMYCVEIVDGEVSDGVSFINDATGSMSFTKDDDGKYYFTANRTGTYKLRVFSTDSSMSIKLTKTYTAGEKIDGQTTDTLTGFDPGTEYVCRITYKNGTEVTSDAVYPEYAITHQPTVTEPYVEVNGSKGASYQWYKANKKSTAVTDKNATVFDAAEFDPEMVPLMTRAKASYDSATGEWTGAMMSYDDGQTTLYAYYYFEKEYKAGDVLVVETSEEPEMCVLGRMADNFTTQGVSKDGKILFTIPDDGKYVLSVLGSSDDITAKASVESMTAGEKLSGQTADTLTQLDMGAYYYCEVTFADDRVIRSDAFLAGGAFIRQPTAKDPSVEVTFPDKVTGYQWHEVTKVNTPVTDANVTLLDSVSYDSATGKWSGVGSSWGDGEYLYRFFVIELKAGDVLTVECSDEPIYGEVYDPVSGYFDEGDIDGDTIVFTAPEDGNYVLYVSTESDSTTVKAWVPGIELGKKLDGQTAAKLTAAEKGKTYACAVIYDDGTAIVSDFFTATEDTVKHIEDAKKQENADAVKDKINALPATVTKDDEAAIKAAKAAYDALTEEEKALLDTETVSKLNAALAALEKLNAPVQDGGRPDTGDSSNAPLWIAIMVISALCIVGAVCYIVKSKKETK